MGLDRSVALQGSTPTWQQLTNRLRQRGLAVKLQMIDGELAFPNEEPSPDWRELRLGTPAGMVTLRREPAAINLIVWGNADAALLAERDVIADAIGEAAS